MDLTNSALTTLFIAVIYSLVRVVEYFITKRNGNGNGKGLTHAQEEKVDKLLKYSEHLDELHSVYTENHVPKWYVPADLLTVVRNIDKEMSMHIKEEHEDTSEIKAGQAVLVDKLSDLINSQRLMTERLGDLIAKLNKISN